MIAPCPICHDIGGFHLDDCGSAITVPRELLVVNAEPAKVKLSPEEIAQRRAEAAARKATEEGS